MTHGSLSTGICGFDIGAEQNGIETKWTCEIDPLRQDIIKWKLPNATHYGDMRLVKKPEYVDIISFGFPCQDISQANPKGEGLEGSKSGLWHEGWRIIRAVRPPIIVIENSPMLIHKGLRTILGQFTKAGYDAEWQIISCKTFGLPHLRKRLFIIGYSNKIGRQKDCRIQGRVADKNPPAKDEGRQVFQSEFIGNSSWQDWSETIRSVHYLDDGIPKNILYGILEAAGDTVSPRVTAWIFSKIKESFQVKLASNP